MSLSNHSARRRLPSRAGCPPRVARSLRRAVHPLASLELLELRLALTVAGPSCPPWDVAGLISAADDRTPLSVAIPSPPVAQVDSPWTDASAAPGSDVSESAVPRRIPLAAQPITPRTVAEFTPLGPLGSLGAEAELAGAITSPAQEDEILLELDAGQTVSVSAISDSKLALELELLDPNDNRLREGSVTVSGQTLVWQSVPAATAGTYRLLVGGLRSTTGSYAVRILLNASFELEDLRQGTNNDLASAQDISLDAVDLANGSAQRSLVVGSGGNEYAEDFEKGALDERWLLSTSARGGVVDVLSELGASHGRYSLVMGRSEPTIIPTRNEATWTVNLAGMQSAILTFDHTSFQDDLDPLPASFVQEADGDGVSISADGVNWYRIVDAKDIPEGQWVTETVDLVAATQSAGIALGAEFRIRFQQFDDTTFPADGRAYDHIDIQITPAPRLEDWYRISLADGQSASFVYTELGQGTATLLELYDPSSTLLANGEPTAAGSYQISNFSDTSTDGVPASYYLRVLQPAEKYTLLVTRNSTFDASPNDSLSRAQTLGPDLAVLGYVGDEPLPSHEVLDSFAGPGFTGFIPPDPILAVGPKQVVAMVNTTLSIFDKETNASLFTQSVSGAQGFFGNVGATTTVFDPWVVFDRDTQRFFLISIDVVSRTESSMYVAVSTSATPTDGASWHKYRFDFTHYPEPLGLGLEAHFPDYPKMSVSRDALFVSSNYFPIASGSGVYSGIVAIEKGPLLEGGPARKLYEEYFTGFSVFPIQQAEPDGTQYFAEAFNSTTIRLHAVSNVTTNPQRHTTLLTVPSYLDPVRVPQLGGGALLDPVSSRIMGGTWRDGSAWFTHGITDPATGDNENVARWYEVETRSFPLGTPVLKQYGNADPGPDVHAWMPGLAVDGEGNLAIGFSMGGNSLYASAGFMGRLATDAPGTITRAAKVFAEGRANYTLRDSAGRNRWGDYSGLVVDPQDDTTFWVMNEYATSVGVWGTRIASFRLASVPESDYYKFEVLAGDVLNIETSTPFDGPLLAANGLDTRIELYGPNLALLAADNNSVSDGRNARIQYVATQTGTYRVAVKAQESDGTYVLRVTGATGGNPPPFIVAAEPAAGRSLKAFPTTYRLAFSETIATASIQATDLLVNNVSATSVRRDGNSLVYTLDPAIYTGDGTYRVTMPAGAVQDLQGQLLATAYQATFSIDTAGPRIVETRWNAGTLPSSKTFLPGPFSFQARFNEDIFTLASARRGPLAPGVDDIVLRNADTQKVVDESFVQYSRVTDLFEARYDSLPEGNYELTLVSGPGAFQDDAGNNLDGEPLGPNLDGTLTGNGVEGGAYTRTFVVDADSLPLKPFQRLAPLGSLVSRSLGNMGYINSSSDLDQFTFFGQAGEKITARLALGGAVPASLTLIGPNEPRLLGTSAAAGAAIHADSILLEATGVYQFRIAASDRVAYQLDVVRNASVEMFTADSTPQAARSIQGSLIALGLDRLAVVGTTEKRFGFQQTNDPSRFVDISGNGRPLVLADDGEVTIETTVGNEVMPAGYITVANNGGILAGIDLNLYFVNLPLPAPDIGRALFAYWDDLGLSSEPVYWSEQKVDGVDTLIVQWQNSPHYPAIGDVTFQMQVFATGSTLARFVYSDVEFGDPLLDFGASATIGYQVNEREAYEFNFGAADISSNFLPTRPVANGDVVDLILLPDIDDYTVDLNAFRGKAIDIGLAGTSGQDFRSAQLQLLDSTGKVVAEATREPLGALSDNYSLAIAGWRVPNAGDSSYTLRVSSNMVGEYGLVVTGTAMLEIEPNQGPDDPLRSLAEKAAALGYLEDSGDEDRYRWSLPAHRYAAITLTPLLADADANPPNDLQPEILVLAEDGTLINTIFDLTDAGDPQYSFPVDNAQTVTIQVISSTGAGEYRLEVEALEYDYGDAPDAYATTIAADGARHAGRGPRFGNRRDLEPDGQPSADAVADDLAGPRDDEDGVIGATSWMPGQVGANLQVSVQNSPNTSFVNAWIDFNGDLQWSDEERIASNVALGNGSKSLPFNVPAGLAVGPRIARLRISSNPLFNPFGIAVDGEVEDHTVEIKSTPSVSISDTQRLEGTGGLTEFAFTVTRSHAASSLQVTVATEAGTATEGSDYLPVTTVLNFPQNGPLQQTVIVSVVADADLEPDETFRVVLSAPVATTLEDAIAEGTIIDDDSLLRVASIRASSSRWSTAMLRAVDQDWAAGYLVSTIDAATKPLPWTQLDRITVEFTTDVRASLDPLAFRLLGATAGPVAVHDFTYDPARNALTLLFRDPLRADRYTLHIDDSISGADGLPLDGEWASGVSSGSSGDGKPGGDFDFPFAVLPADIDGDGVVTTADLELAMASVARSAGSPGYNPRSDLNGTGRVAGTDLSKILRRMTSRIPVPAIASPAPAAILPTAAVDDLFAGDSPWSPRDAAEADEQGAA